MMHLPPTLPLPLFPEFSSGLRPSNNRGCALCAYWSGSSQLASGLWPACGVERPLCQQVFSPTRFTVSPEWSPAWLLAFGELCWAHYLVCSLWVRSFCSPCVLSLAEPSFQGCGRHHPSNPLYSSLLPYARVPVLPGFTGGNWPASIVTLAGCGPLPSVLQCPVPWASLSWCHLLFCSPCPGGYKPLFFFFYHLKGLDLEEAEAVVINPPSPLVFFITPFRISSKFLGM